MVFFDNNSTTQPLSLALQAFIDVSEKSWANPSSPHRQGRRVRVLLESAREEISQSLGVEPHQLTFTSGATESNNTIFSWVRDTHKKNLGGCIISAIEHPSILESAQFYFDGNVRLIPTDSDGVVQLEEFEKLLEKKLPQLVSLIAVHNETGVVQPWREIARICKDRRIWFHCDATQWIGKLDHAELNCCWSFSFSAHKFGGIKGVGGLFSCVPPNWMKGGGQEMETRGGTENLPGIEGMRVAWKHQCPPNLSVATHQKWKKIFEDSLLGSLSHLKVIGHQVPRLWNTSLLCLPEFDNLSWVGKLDKLGFSVSTGSACSTAREQPSSLAGAIGLTEAESRRLVRVSSYTDTTEQQWIELADAFKQALLELRSGREQTGVISL